MSDRASGAELAELESKLDLWLADQVEENPAVLTVERDVDGGRVWYVRMKGEDKEGFTIRFRLGERTLAYDTHFMPAPEENHAQLFEHLLRRNGGWYGAAFAVGEEDAVYLVGHLAVRMLDADELDRVLGSVYAIVEQCFLSALRIGFASRFEQ